MTDRSLTEALANTIETARRAERDIFGGLDAASRQRPIRTDDWSPKDFQAHLTAWKARQADRFEAVREGREMRPALADEEEDALNAELRAMRVDWTWDAVVDEADAVTARLAGEIRRADPGVVRATDRLLGGTLGNGVLHSLTHFRWLVEAGVRMDAERLATFADEAGTLFADEAIPPQARAVGLYDLACYHALRGMLDAARALLREAFRLDHELLDFGRTDTDLEHLHGELDDLAT
jgi:hypothetical protein